MDFQKLVQFGNQQDSLNLRMGVVIEEIRPGYARTRKTVEPHDIQPFGCTHGGVYFTLADTTCGSAAATHGQTFVTIDASYHFFRGAMPGDVLTAEAREVKSGKTVCVYDVRITDQREKLLGNGTFTFYLLPQKLEF